MIVNNGSLYLKAPFSSEDELEQVVKNYSEYLFGSDIIFLPKSKITTLGGAGTIPDGFVIDVRRSGWYVVEVELACHGTWQHIAPQISKQLVAIVSHKSKELLVKNAVECIKNDALLVDIFEDAGIKEIDIQGTIFNILNKPPTIAIPIDAIPQDLEEWVKTLKYDAKIWVIEKYLSSDGKSTCFSMPEENRPTMASTISKDESTIVRATRWSQPYQDLFASGLILDGQKLMLEYGPRGKPKKSFTAVVRQAGIEFEGKVMSLSAAAVVCIKKAGGTNEFANGWSMWKTEGGKYMSQYYDEVISAQEQEESQPAPNAVALPLLA